MRYARFIATAILRCSRPAMVFLMAPALAGVAPAAGAALIPDSLPIGGIQGLPPSPYT